jgi:prenyltransferase beta subunit
VSVRLDMLAALQRSLSRLGDASALIDAYVRGQVVPGGGFRDRAGRPDLYYSVFGIELLLALGVPLPADTVPYLLGFGLGESLDLVHLSCLIRARNAADIVPTGSDAAALAARLEACRSADGGYDSTPGARMGSAYGCFLVAAAYEDLGLDVPSRGALLDFVSRLRACDGGYGNFPEQQAGLTPTTAAVATLLRSLDQAVPDGVEAWLLSMRDPASGFFAVPGAPVPDLLSTATALHALACSGTSLDGLREPCLDFVRSLWNGDGAFGGSWADPTPDGEYTFYGLLALGHLVE